MPKDTTLTQKTKRKRYDETKRGAKLNQPRAAANPQNRTERCWIHVTSDTIKDVVDDTISQGKDIRIITAESAYCSICHTDHSKANISAPNSILGHCRRVKKCLQEKKRQNIVILGLKVRKPKGDPTLWDSVDTLRLMNEEEFPMKAYYLDRVMPDQPPQESESNRPAHSYTAIESPSAEESWLETTEMEAGVQKLDEEDGGADEAIHTLCEDRNSVAPNLPVSSTHMTPHTLLPSNRPTQRSASPALRQPSSVTSPTDAGGPSPSFTADVDLSPYSSGIMEGNLLMPQPDTQSGASLILATGSQEPAPTVSSSATLAATMSHQPQPSQSSRVATHPHISPPVSYGPRQTLVPLPPEEGVSSPSASDAGTACSIRRARAESNPPLTMTYSLPPPVHVSPPLGPLQSLVVGSERIVGHGHGYSNSYSGSTGMVNRPGISHLGQPYHGHIRTGSEGYTHRPFASNVTMGGYTPAPRALHEPVPHPYPSSSHPPLRPAASVPAIPRIAMPSPRVPISQLSFSPPQSQSTQPMHPMHQPLLNSEGAAPGRGVAGGDFPGLGLWMDPETQGRRDNLSPGGRLPPAKGLPAGFGLRAFDAKPANTIIQRSSSGGPYQPLGILGYAVPAESQTRESTRLLSRDALGLHSAHVHPQGSWPHPSAGFNYASSSFAPSPGNTDFQQREAGPNVVLGASYEAVVGEVAYFEASQSTTTTDAEPQTQQWSQGSQEGPNFDEAAYEASNGIQSPYSANYELVPGAAGSSLHANLEPGASLSTRHQLAESHQQDYLYSGWDSSWNASSPSTGPPPVMTRRDETFSAPTGTSLEIQGMMANKGGRAQLARRMQAGDS